MARRTRLDLVAQINTRFNDNTTGQITPERARAMFQDIIDSLVSISDDTPTFINERGSWSTTDALPNTGSGTAGSNRLYDKWRVPIGGWTYLGNFYPYGTFIEALKNAAVNFEDFKIY